MDSLPILRVSFFRSLSGTEYVRDWLKGLSVQDRKTIGEDIKLVQFRWPLGMPLVRKFETGLWEVRSHLVGGRISRVFFTIDEDEMILLHGFQKRSQKTAKDDLNLARSRQKQWIQGKWNE